MLSGFLQKPAMFILASVWNTFLILGQLVIPTCNIYWGMWPAELWSPPGPNSVPGFCSTCSGYKWDSEQMNKSSYPSPSTKWPWSISVESPLSRILVQPLSDADVVTTPAALHSYDIEFLNRNWSTGVRAGSQVCRQAFLYSIWFDKCQNNCNPSPSKSVFGWFLKFYSNPLKEKRILPLLLFQLSVW